MEITEKQIQQAKQEYLLANFTINNNESHKAGLTYLAGVRMVLEKTGHESNCYLDCPDIDCGNCCNPSNCSKFYF